MFYRLTPPSNTSVSVFAEATVSAKLKMMSRVLTAVSDIFQKRKSVRPTVVALLAEERDRAVVSDLCRRSHWDVSFARTCPDALARIGQVKAQILFMDRDLAGPDWRETMSAFASSSEGACIMLVSKVIDGSLWNDVVRSGGYEVLSKPLREDDVSRVMKLAWSYWNSSVKR